MPSVSVDDNIYTDPRLKVLTGLLDPDDPISFQPLAIGMLINAVRMAYPFWKSYNAVPAFLWKMENPKGDQIIESGFAERLPDGSVLFKNMRDIYAYESDEEREQNN